MVGKALSLNNEKVISSQRKGSDIEIN